MIEEGTLLQKRYKIEKKIGQGGMGAVYVAVDERFGSVVAIKETLVTDPNLSKAFEREARLLNNLRHSALPRVSDHFSDDNGQFIVMEYIDGEDLSAMMENKVTAFPIKDVLNWADQLLDALDYLHTQEMPVVHRDIKPQNLKLTPRGQIILLDFGLAKGNPTDARNHTATKSVFGYSRNYASIEQMQGTGTDPRSDIYSLGATLYHLITGVSPVDALTRAMKVLNGDSDPLQLANTVHPQVPYAVADILHRAMSLNSNHRPSSALAMRTMLAEAASQVSEEIISSSYRVPSANILTQNTEIFESNQSPRETQQGAVKTELFTKDAAAEQTKLFENNSSEIETSVKTRVENYKNGIQPTGVNREQTHNTLFVGEIPKRKKYAAAASGIVLLTGIALGGIYTMKPEVLGLGNASSTSVVIENKNAEQNDSNANATLANTANTANTSSETIATTKKGIDKKATETPTPKSSSAPKDENKEVAQKDENLTDTNGKKIFMMDKEGNKIYEDGTIKASDGTIVYPDGRVFKDGKLIANPKFNIKINPQTPVVRIPPIPREEMEKLTQEQQRKIKEAMERQRQNTENQRIETRRTETRRMPGNSDN